MDPVIRSPAIFVGRTTELARVVSAASAVRLGVVYGIGGAGKTAFLFRAAEEVAARNNARICHHACRPGESAASLSAAVLGQLGKTPPPGTDAVAALGAVAQAKPVVVVVDDAHRTTNPTLVDGLIGLAALRAPLWILAGSRAHLAISPVAVDHVVVRLGELSADEAQTLYGELSRLYGAPPRALDDAPACGLTPLAIKQTFARGTAVADPLGLAALDELQAAVLAELAAHRTPVPAAALAHGRDPVAFATTLERLARAFLFDVDGSGAIGLHDTVREAIVGSSRGPDAAIHRRCIAWLRTRPPELLTEIEILHHSIASGDAASATEILSRHAVHARMFPPDAVTERELVAAVDALAPRGSLPAELVQLAARMRARQGAAAAAYAELATVAPRSGLVHLDLGECAYILGRFADAETHLGRAVASGGINPIGRALAWSMEIDCRRHRGEIAAAEKLLAKPPADAGVPPAVFGIAADWLACVLHFDQERYREAAAAIASLRAGIGQSPHLAATIPLSTSYSYAIDRALGHATSRPGDGEQLADTLYLRLPARILHATGLGYDGELGRAAELGREIANRAWDAGYPALALWAEWRWAEHALALGRAREVLARARAVRDRAEDHPRAALRLHVSIARAQLILGDAGAARTTAVAALRSTRYAAASAARLRAIIDVAGAATGQRARATTARTPPPQGYDRADIDLLRAEAALWRGDLELATRAARIDEAWPALVARARLVAAEVAYRRGDLAGASAALDAVDVTRGQAVEACRRALLAGALARMSGAADAAASRWREAARLAELAELPVEAAAATIALGRRGRAGEGLARRLHLDQAASIRFRDAAATRWLVPAQHAAIDGDYGLVVDLVALRIRAGRREIDLERHAIMVSLLAALAREPGSTVSVTELVRAAWDVEYHPIRHHSRVTMAVSRLREMVGSRLVKGDRDGYRLSFTGTWAVAEPVA